MIYVADIDMSAGGSADSPVETRLVVTKGLIYRVEIQFPYGCAGLVYLQALDGNHQLWPSTPGSWFSGEGTISFEETLLKLVEPWELLIRSYNLDDTYSHKVQFRLGMVDTPEFMSRYLPSMAYQDLVRYLQEQQAAQAANVPQLPLFFQTEIPAEGESQ